MPCLTPGIRKPFKIQNKMPLNLLPPILWSIFISVRLLDTPAMLIQILLDISNLRFAPAQHKRLGHLVSFLEKEINAAMPLLFLFDR